MKDILTVGATGVIGTELVKQLSAAGRRFRAIVRSEAKANHLPLASRPCNRRPFDSGSPPHVPKQNTD
jgi:uncharacterized protein YbjT (DUF2867 family)